MIVVFAEDEGRFATAAEDARFMRLALDLAREAAAEGEVPVGAVVVHIPWDKATRRRMGEPRVIATGKNMREQLHDASAHAETLAMRRASEVLDAWRLADCTVYVTLEPCIMCAGLMHQARIARCVFGARDPKAGALGSLYQVNTDERLNHTFDVTPGVLADESSALLKSFFADRR